MVILVNKLYKIIVGLLVTYSVLLHFTIFFKCFQWGLFFVGFGVGFFFGLGFFAVLGLFGFFFKLHYNPV